MNTECQELDAMFPHIPQMLDEAKEEESKFIASLIASKIEDELKVKVKGDPSEPN